VEGAGSDDDDGADETGSVCVSVEGRVRVADTEGSWSEDLFVDVSPLFPMRSENDIGDGCGPRERTAA